MQGIALFPELLDLQKRGRIDLNQLLTIDELYRLMSTHWDKRQYGDFRLVKGLFVTQIHLEKFIIWDYTVDVVKQGERSIVNIASVQTKPKQMTKQEKEMIEAMGGFEATKQPFIAKTEAYYRAMREILVGKLA